MTKKKKKNQKDRFKCLAYFLHYNCQMQPTQSYESCHHLRDRQAAWRKLEGLKSQCWNWKQRVPIQMLICASTECYSFLFSTMRPFVYSLLFWSKTDVFNSQSPNCYSFVTYLCNSCKHTLLLKLLYLKIIKLLNVWKIEWQSFMNPPKHQM